MGVEVAGFEMVQGPVETVAVGDGSVLHEKENGKLDQGLSSHEPIQFGSHGEEPIKEDENGVADAKLPKDAIDEWPAPKQIHSFYFVRYRPYDDPKIKAKIDQASTESEKRTQARIKITDQLKAKRSDRGELISQIRALKDDNRQFRTIVDEKIKEIEPLHQALGKLRNANNANRGVCSSEEELNSLIHSLQYRIQHESIPLSEEKQILREIKLLEGTREKVVANAAMRAKLQESMVQKEALQDQVKLIGGDLDGVRKEQQTLRAKIKQLEDALKVIDKDISVLQDELTAVTERRDKARESIQQFRKQREDGNSYFYQSRSVLNKARDLAAKKDIQGLEELSNLEVEKFMALWSSTKSFRDDYERRILPSLDSRQLSRDGRMRNPDEKPLLAPEEPAPVESGTVAKALPKRAKEDPKPPQVEALPAQKVQKEVQNKSTNSKPPVDHTDAAEKEIAESEKLPIETPKKKETEVDAAKLKEIKREEEITKAKQAMERKKKLAEKAAAKAAIRAQKEAEKKNKEREKKLKKKNAANALDSNSEEAAEPVAEDAEPEKENENVEASAAPKEKKEKAQKETTTVRLRGRARGPESIPKAILKRKKATNYWVWAVPAAAALCAVFVALGYRYLL